MKDWDDITLLRQYTERDSEAAFAVLVERHVNKVYSVALRYARSPHQAEEISQVVFVILAKKARALGSGVVLSGWLYQTARLASVTLTKSEIRRHRREQEAYMQSVLNESDSETWKQIAPLLDDAMARLGEKDRNALVLRYFDGKSMKEVGSVLETSEDAAKMRVNRALEKLRCFFLKRGVASTVSFIAGAVSAHSVQAAPAGLAPAITAAAVAREAAVGSSTLTLIKGTLKLMAWTKMKTTVVVGAVALLATTTTVVVCKTSHGARLRENVARAKRGVPTDPNAIALAEANSKILIFRDVRSWGRKPDFEEVLNGLHYKFDVKPSTDMAMADLSAYDVIIIPGAQWKTTFYRDYGQNAERFENYASSGGTLVLELNGAEGTGITLPGGVRMVQHGAVDNELTVPEHPILLPLGGRPIHANFASHGYLTGVPKTATILAVEMNRQSPVMNRPTFVEYTLGSGRVIAGCQCFHDRDGSGRGPLMPTLVDYAAVKQWFTLRRNAGD